jgi:ATP-dependent Clp protease ATP-binding subunit ClpA
VNRNIADRLDQAAQRVLEAAFHEAANLGEAAVGTESLLLALATADSVTKGLLSEAGGGAADLRRMMVASRRPRARRDHETLLATLGIDVAEVRRQVEQSLGKDATFQAASRVRPSRPRRPLWTWISCSRPLSGPRRDSPLAGQPLELIPRVTRLLGRATRAARPRLASPSHLLLALITGNEPSCEVLDALCVDLDALASATRHSMRKLAGNP